VTTAATDVQATDRPILKTAGAVDAVANHPVLVIGSPPPHGRDLDLVAMPADYAAISQLLVELGHLRRRSSWVRFDPAGVSAVDLYSTDSLHLAGSLHRLFEDAVPVPGYGHLVRPAPHVVLLLAARGLVGRRGQLTTKARRRVERALDDDTEAWSRAAEVAHELGLVGPLNVIRQTMSRSAALSPLARVRALAAVALAPDPVSTKAAQLSAALPRRIRPALVSLSGPHGTGKSTQVEALNSTLNHLGVVTETQWAPAPPRQLPPIARTLSTRLWRSSRSEHAPTSGPLGPVTVSPTAPKSALVRLLAHAWCTEGAIVCALRMWRYALRPRRAQVLLLDRFTVDASVTLAYWLGHRRGVDLKVEQALLRLVSPRPRVSVLLLADAGTLHSRRADEYTLEGFHLLRTLYAEAGDQFGAVLIDANRPVEVVARDVATLVWERLS
jgi:thymidylate kinase